MIVETHGRKSVEVPSDLIDSQETINTQNKKEGKAMVDDGDAGSRAAVDSASYISIVRTGAS
jgi:hypothetical protein